MRRWLSFLPILVWLVFWAAPNPAQGRVQDGSQEKTAITGNFSYAPALQQPQGSAAQFAGHVQELFKTASSLIQQSRYEEAAGLLRIAEKAAPGQASIHHYLGYALWKQDQWNTALAEFQKARELDPQNPYTLYFLARIAQSTGRTAESIKYYEAALRLGPAIEDTHQRLGQLYFDEGKIEKARENIEAALQQTPWESSLYYQLGKIDQKAGRVTAAREEFGSAERLKNANQEAVQRLLALDQAVRNHELEKTGKLRTELLAESSHDPEILQSVGVLLGRAGLYGEAGELLERCVRLDPNSFEAQYNLGLTFLRLHRAQDAESRLQAALKLQPESAEANRALAVLYVNENRNADAIERLRVANQAAPGDAKILALLGAQYLQGRFVGDAISTLEQAVKLAPENPNVRFLLVEAYYASRQYDQGLQVAQEAMRLFPGSARAPFQVAQELAALGRYEDAGPYAEKAVQEDPQMADGWNLLGDLESRRGQYDLAVKAFERARSLDPSNVTAARGSTGNLIRLKRYGEALAELQQALSAHPQDAGLYFNLMQVYTRTGKHEEASKAGAIYKQLHSQEVAQQEAQTPRRYIPAAGTARPGHSPGRALVHLAGRSLRGSGQGAEPPGRFEFRLSVFLLALLEKQNPKVVMSLGQVAAESNCLL
jgi:tetratricopeptide (TPR) repeat protein